ncbi:MAG: glycosyltransferase family 2 protein, partial [Gammaproteobacteria bacterium]|nr:glycosyltransferase family 2 protein [Gammaproteobacteria bacterium]
GQFIKYGAWGNDWVVRLFKRGSAQFSDDIVHEKLIVTGNIERLKNWLWHDSCKNLETALQKVNSYSTLGAQMKWKQGKRTSLLGALGHGVWTFLKVYLFKRGFLDGRAGWVLSWVTAAGSYYRYLKLLYLQDKQHDEKSH